jgi:hypothetical protein
MLACVYHPSYAGGVSCRNIVQASLGKTLDLISKITKAKRAEGVPKAVESLPSKHKA